ncbi:hypothetical protein GGR58DRAFT_519680 [Xylaria digitata]|nr:hypothetical protein GGR58DRAFT_519680 [Xylaria digitata]
MPFEGNVVPGFHLAAPWAKLALSWSGKLGEILFDGSAETLITEVHISATTLVGLLAVPVQPQHQSSRNSPVNSNNTVCGENRGAKRTRDNNDVHTESSRPRKQIKVHDRNEKIVSNAIITLSSLPLELHRLIFSFIEDIIDIISFGITNRYFLSIGRECLEDYYISYFGQWAGTNIVCVGDCLEVLRHKTIGTPFDWNYPNEAIQYLPFTLRDYTYPQVSTIMGRPEYVLGIACFLMGSCTRRRISRDPAYRYIERRFIVKNETYFPTDQQWILRNPTTKQIMHSNAIALSPDDISGPDIRNLGFGEVVMSRICWSTDPSTSMNNDTTNITRGAWAGHCFDITTLSRHEAETRGEEWTDVSDEVAREIASIWEGEYGANWREIISKGKHY